MLHFYLRVSISDDFCDRPVIMLPCVSRNINLNDFVLFRKRISPIEMNLIAAEVGDRAYVQRTRNTVDAHQSLRLTLRFVFGGSVRRTDTPLALERMPFHQSVVLSYEIRTGSPAQHRIELRATYVQVEKPRRIQELGCEQFTENHTEKIAHRPLLGWIQSFCSTRPKKSARALLQRHLDQRAAKERFITGSVAVSKNCVPVRSPDCYGCP